MQMQWLAHGNQQYSPSAHTYGDADGLGGCPRQRLQVQLAALRHARKGVPGPHRPEVRDHGPAPALLMHGLVPRVKQVGGGDDAGLMAMGSI
jgi:hypothetical protein